MRETGLDSGLKNRGAPEKQIIEIQSKYKNKIAIPNVKYNAVKNKTNSTKEYKIITKQKINIKIK